MSSFASTRKQRGTNVSAGSSNRDVDFSHASDLTTSSMMYRSMNSTAPGSDGQRWATSPRKAPFFHVASRPYSFGVGQPRGREPGVDRFYDPQFGTLGQKVINAPRRYL